VFALPWRQVRLLGGSSSPLGDGDGGKNALGNSRVAIRRLCPSTQCNFRPIALRIASLNRSAGNGLSKNAVQPKSIARCRCCSSRDSVMIMTGTLKPIAARRIARSTPEISPRWISITMHAASDVVAALRNSSADVYNSVRYPHDESIRSII